MNINRSLDCHSNGRWKLPQKLMTQMALIQNWKQPLWPVAFI